MEVVIRTSKANGVVMTTKVPCPICRRTDLVGNVTSARTNGGAVVYRKYCRNCLMEFDNNGKIVPPLY